ncbi:MAG: DUF1801 domain-containing protein [Lewinellaceae bacterium]|nr:DUF1801 domain-containing protein [Lewinellaceae bacterium]
MQIHASNPEEYISKVEDPDKKIALNKLREICLSHLPDGFEEAMAYGMFGYVVPHSLYPKGYHCDPKTPLPFLSFAAQKNFIGIYHMGLYMMPELYDWFVSEHAAYPKKLDMGKSCIRYKKEADIPYPLITELVQKITPSRYIEVYETALRK